jgi:hypothetical protein
MSEADSMLPILFKIPYQPNRTPRLICFNEDEKYFLISSLFPRQFECLSMNTRQISPINISFDETLLNLGYSTKYHRFYLTTKKTNRFIFFRLNEEDKQIEIEREIELIKEKDRFINVHIFDNIIFFLYLTSSSIVIFGKYDLETSSFLQSINFEKKLYDNEEQCPYRIIDFTINSTFICFLIQLKKNENKNKSKIIIHDYETINQIYSFDLIDAVRPISIVSTEK